MPELLMIGRIDKNPMMKAEIKIQEFAARRKPGKNEDDHAQRLDA
jgi:hypothetical protein